MSDSESLSAVEAAVRDYFDQARTRVDAFTASHFTFEGSWKIHRQCLKGDLIRNPVNTLLSVPILGAKKIVQLADKLGWEPAQKVLSWIPGGLKTDYERQVEQRLLTEVFGVNPSQAVRKNAADFLAAAILKVPHPQQLDEGSPAVSALRRSLQKTMRPELEEFFAARATVSDLASTGITLLIGKMLFHEVAWSAVEIGNRIASLFAKKRAASSFFLGEGIGSAFYDVFPAKPTEEQIFFATAGVMVFVAILTFFTHVVSDPVQHALGFHRTKLHRMLSHFEVVVLQGIHRELKAAARAAPAAEAVASKRAKG